MPKRIKFRDYSRTEHDDFVLNIQPYLEKHLWATEIRDKNNNLIGWEIKPAYE